jgi:hypothetical protein
MMLLINTASFHNKADQVSMEEMPGGRAILLSSPELHIYTVEISPVNAGRRDAEISARLKSRYPGNLDEAVICYSLGRIRRDKEQPYRRATVFLMDKETLAAYMKTGKPLVPGLALLETAFRCMKKREVKDKPVLAVFIGKTRIEAAFFEDRELKKHIGARINTGEAADGIPFFSLLRTLRDDSENSGMMVLIVPRETNTAYDDPGTEQLLEMFPKNRIIGFEKTLHKLKIKKVSVFRKPAGKPLRFLAAPLLTAACFFLLSAFRNFGAGLGNELKALEVQKAEYLRNREETERLLGEISERKSREEMNTERTVGAIEVYTVIGEINSRLAGAWVRSLSIDGDRFTLEAEGADSIAVLRGLEQSGRFYNLALHQAFPSELRGERFGISGRVYHEE